MMDDAESLCSHSLSLSLSVETVNDGSFHAVELVASDQTLSLSIDGGTPKSINSISKQSTLNIDSPLYLGGEDPSLFCYYNGSQSYRVKITFDFYFILNVSKHSFLPPGMPERASASGGLSALQHSSGGRNGTSFHGCLRNLYINGKLQDLGAGLGPGAPGSGTAQSTTRQWLGQGVEPGCQPCQRGACIQGECHATGHRGFTCTCNPGWTGAVCDQQVNNPCDGNK